VRGFRFFHRGAFGFRHPFIHVALILLALLVIAAIVMVIVMSVRKHQRPGHSHSYSHHPVRDDSSERILRDRLARGEITQDEYRQTAATLRGET
jgi:uncharacterized membrane protein